MSSTPVSVPKYVKLFMFCPAYLTLKSNCRLYLTVLVIPWQWSKGTTSIIDMSYGSYQDAIIIFSSKQGNSPFAPQDMNPNNNEDWIRNKSEKCASSQKYILIEDSGNVHF